VHSAPHNPDIIAISCVPIARAAPLILADAQGYFADQNITVSLRKYAGWTGRYSR